jgi:hypothetical protein
MTRPKPVVEIPPGTPIIRCPPGEADGLDDYQRSRTSRGRKPGRIFRLRITCEKCGHVTELECARSKLRNLTARCQCGASLSFRCHGVKGTGK